MVFKLDFDRGPLCETGPNNAGATGNNHHFQLENQFSFGLCFSSACCQQNLQLIELLHAHSLIQINLQNKSKHTI